jgi:hypothetical protein
MHAKMRAMSVSVAEKKNAAPVADKARRARVTGANVQRDLKIGAPLVR